MLDDWFQGFMVQVSKTRMIPQPMRGNQGRDPANHQQWQDIYFTMFHLSHHATLGFRLQSGVPPRRVASSQLFRPWDPHTDHMSRRLRLTPGAPNNLAAFKTVSSGWVLQVCWQLTDHAISSTSSRPGKQVRSR